MYSRKTILQSLPKLIFLFIIFSVLTAIVAPHNQAVTGAAEEYKLFLPVLNKLAEPDVPTVGFATGTDRTLIRWYCNAPCNTQFNVYRQFNGGSEQLMGTIGREADSAAAILTLNSTDSRWPTLYNDLLTEYEDQNITSISDLYGMLDENMLFAQKLTNEYYPVALINGWGYLDTSFQEGASYTYRVERTADGTTIGSVKLIAGQLTPLLAPEGVQALQLTPGDSEFTHNKTADWGAAQADRRFHQNAYLRWDVGEPGASGYPAAWIIGYDIYRASADTPDDFAQVNGDISVQPIAASQPDIVGSDNILSTAAQNDYQTIEHFYADHTKQQGDFLYRVAPRDALGQIRQWPTDNSQFSEAVEVTTYDFMPPAAPQNPQAIINEKHTQVTLTWDMPDPPADLASFRIERTYVISNNLPASSCNDFAACWVEVAVVDKETFKWVDSDSTLEQMRWYRLQAVDESGNRSMYTMPVQAVLHDIEPPSKPDLRVRPCSLTPSDPTPDYCIEGGGDSDVTRYLVGCTFWPDSDEIYLIEIEAEPNGALASYLITDLYDPPFDLDDVACTVRAVDERGNISEPSDPAIIDEWVAEEPPVLPNPIISDITTVSLTELGNAMAEIEWEMPDSPLIGSFRIDRDLLSGEFNVPAVMNGIDGTARSYLDNDINAGELYSYTVTAELKFGLGELASQPRIHRVVSDGRRPLARFDLTNINWTENSGTELLWNACDPDGGAIDGIRYFAVYRSINENNSYNQITPIFPASACVSGYIDDSAQHGRYFYSIMEFDGRTGEPVGYTIPVQFDNSNAIQTDDTTVVNPSDGLIQNTTYTPNAQIFVPNCTAIDPAGNDFSQPLLFGDGFEVHNLVVNVAGNNISGTGDLRVNNEGNTINIPVNFTNITVADAQNHVCTGFITADVVSALGVSILVTSENGFAYEVLALTVRPFYANISHGSGRIRVQMPRSIRVLDASGSEADMLNLAGPQLSINADLAFTFQLPDISAISTHGCDAADDPIVGFALETMPTIVVPDGQFTVTPTTIDMAASCMDYHERYNPAHANGYNRPAAGTLTAGDSNDGFLRGRYHANQAGTAITPNGLAGTFNSGEPLAYVASYPFGFSLELNGAKTLTIGASHIMSGSLGAGQAAFLYHQTVADTTQTKLTVNFNELTVDANGGLYAPVVSTDPVAVEWMLPNGFVAGLLHAELYLGQMTTDQRPGQLLGEIASSALWATRPADTVELGLENPAELEPGLNVRRDDHGLFWKQCPSGAVAAMDAIVDTYIRHGGVSERFQAQLPAPVTVNVDGYEVEIDNFDISFLDNLDYDSNITGDLMLPFPADLDLRFISMWFGADGCVGGGELLNGYENLAYWNTNVNLNHAVFADEGALPALAGYPHWDRVLRTLGAMELPHVSLPNQPAPALIGVGIGFQPDGNPYNDGLVDGIVLAPNRPNFEFDGFPLLLSGMSLSQLNDAASWDANATAATPPPTNWSQKGYVEINGAIAAPYFGLLVRESGNPGDYPDIRMQLHDNYVGFDEQLKGARVWVDLPIVQIYHEYRNLVYLSSEAEGHGLLIGFREYEFVPQAAITLLGLPQDAQVIHMDASVIMEPQNVHFFLGQSSGTAAFRAMAEATDGVNPALPGDLIMNLWAGKLNMSNDASTGYIALTPEVWPYYNLTDTSFRTTTQALNAYEVEPDQALPNSDEFGGGTLGFVDDVFDLNKMRGHVEVDGLGLGMQLEELQVALEFILRAPDEPKPILYVEMASLNITRHGIYVIDISNARADIITDRIALDGTIIYDPSRMLWELGVGLHKEVGVLHEFESWNVVIQDLTGAGTISGDYRYLGLNLEASWNFYPFKSGAFGGQMVIGTIDPDSAVLQAHFPDVLDHLHIVPAEPGADTSTDLLKGAYFRLYGDTTINGKKIAKVMTLNGGVRLGGWYWSNKAGGEYYGGLAGAYVHTNYLKVVSARGDITFTYEKTPLVENLSAEAWVAGGIGFCEPETWTSWSSRWWNDKWCWSAGAQTELVYDLIEDDFNASWDFDFE